MRQQRKLSWRFFCHKLFLLLKKIEPKRKDSITKILTIQKGKNTTLKKDDERRVWNLATAEDVTCQWSVLYLPTCPSPTPPKKEKKKRVLASSIRRERRREMKRGSLRGLTVCQTSVRFLLYKKNRTVQKYSSFFSNHQTGERESFFPVNKTKTFFRKFFSFFCPFKNFSVPVSSKPLFSHLKSVWKYRREQLSLLCPCPL